jgi:hypothetical protein
MRRFVICLILFMAADCWAQNVILLQPFERKETVTPAEKTKAQIDTDAAEVIKRMNAPRSPSPKLPTPPQAAAKVNHDAAAAGKLASSAEMETAWKAARKAEIDAVRSGHGNSVDPSDLEECQRAIEVEDFNARQAKYEASKKEDLTRNHCSEEVQIGTSETCVYLLMGYPDQTNVDSLSGKQLVYPNDRFVYINTQGNVEDVQSSN